MLHFSLKKRLSKTELLMGMTDVHAHLLPGVDDGVKNLEEAQVVIKFLEQIGVRKIILNPVIRTPSDISCFRHSVYIVNAY